MSKLKHLEEVENLLKLANTAFSDDYLTEKKDLKEIKPHKVNSFLKRKHFEEKKEEIRETENNYEFTSSIKKSEFGDKNYFDLEKIVLNCSKCEAANIRKNIIFGKGVRPATLMVIGEGPGREEDNNNDLFIGKSGQYLHKWLEAIEVNSNEDVYFTNIVKCFSGFNPTQTIVDSCFPYLERQIELVNPKVILILGKIAANNIFKQNLVMKDMRGKIYTYKRIPCIVTYHPAAVLRNPHWRRPVWEDLKKVKQLIDL